MSTPPSGRRLLQGSASVGVAPFAGLALALGKLNSTGAGSTSGGPNTSTASTAR